MSSPLEVILTIIVLSFWFLFPIGMFLSVSHVDKNTDQVIRLGRLRHYSSASDDQKAKRPQARGYVTRPKYQYRKWIHH